MSASHPIETRGSPCPGSRESRAYCTALAGVVLLAAGLLHVALRVHSELLAVPLSIALLLGYAVSRRVRELHAHRDLPGPRPSFFLGNLRSLLSCGHGRDRALLELHRAYGWRRGATRS